MADVKEVIVHIAQRHETISNCSPPLARYRHDMSALNQSTMPNGCGTGRMVYTSESVLLLRN